MRKLKSQNVGECPCEYALRYIGGAWKILIVVILDRDENSPLRRTQACVAGNYAQDPLATATRDGA